MYSKIQRQIHEFNRQIKEAKRAAHYALTLDEKLNCISQVKRLGEQKTQLLERAKQMRELMLTKDEEPFY